MLINRRSIITGIEHGMELPVTTGELLRYSRGKRACAIWPHLNFAQRAFIILGITQDEWDEAVYMSLD